MPHQFCVAAFTFAAVNMPGACRHAQAGHNTEGELWRSSTMGNEENEAKVHPSGQSIDELRLLFSRISREPPRRMDRIGRFIGVIASKIVRNKPRKEKPAA
jgi:hypothetical protein